MHQLNPEVQTPHRGAATYLALRGHQVIRVTRNQFRSEWYSFVFPASARFDLNAWNAAVRKIGALVKNAATEEETHEPATIEQSQ